MMKLKLLLVTSVKSATRQGDVTEVTTTHTWVDPESGQERPMDWYGSEKGDKAPWKTITGNTKQAIQKVLLLPSGDDPEKDDPPPAKPGRNGQANGAPQNGESKPNGAPKPSRSPNESSPHQQQTIEELLRVLNMDFEKDVVAVWKGKSKPSAARSGPRATTGVGGALFENFDPHHRARK